MAKRKGEAIVEEYYVTTERVQSFLRYLEGESHSLGTVEKYRRDILKFQQWLEGRPVSREMVAAWRQQLTARGYAPVTVNSMLGAVNALFRFLGWEEFHAKALRVQRQIFRSEDKELSREEYQRLVTAAKSQKRWRLSLLLETICATGIRVSEVKYITVEAARQGRAEISLSAVTGTLRAGLPAFPETDPLAMPSHWTRPSRLPCRTLAFPKAAPHLSVLVRSGMMAGAFTK